MRVWGLGRNKILVRLWRRMGLGGSTDTVQCFCYVWYGVLGSTMAIVGENRLAEDDARWGHVVGSHHGFPACKCKDDGGEADVQWRRIPAKRSWSSSTVAQAPTDEYPIPRLIILEIDLRLQHRSSEGAKSILLWENEQDLILPYNKVSTSY